tara:strand:+ start:60 stop:371 length:312 start_codon:yes stop_codon:yes gene_type:complete
MIFKIGFLIMFFNEGFVMMRHVSPFFARLRDKVIKKLGENIWYRLHGTLDYLWMGLVTLGLIVNPNRMAHFIALCVFWLGAFMIFYLPRWIMMDIKSKQGHND